jgi:uncharacterized protein with GYD domain
MPKYLVEGRYTSDGLTGLAREGVSRRRADIAKMIESAGGKLEALYFAFGDADFYIIFDVPDNISAAWHQRGRIDFSPPPFAGESISGESGNLQILKRV